LERCEVRRTPHDPAKCIDFAYDRALCNAADRGIAGHLSDRLQRTRNESDSRTNASSCNCRFGSRMPAAYYEDVEISFGWLDTIVGAHELKSSRISAIVLFP
jgi:hypothetical protein